MLFRLSTFVLCILALSCARSPQAILTPDETDAGPGLTVDPNTNCDPCDEGYEVDVDGCSCVDIDECATDNGGCAHVCANAPVLFLASVIQVMHWTKMVFRVQTSMNVSIITGL